MKLLIIDFETILQRINSSNLHTKTFEIYYDISRLLDITITKEACFKLFTKHHDNYGKLKDYLCILGQHPDKKKFDEEFYRRYKQLYFNQEPEILINTQEDFKKILQDVTSNHILALIGTGNIEFMNMMLAHFELYTYFTTIKLSEYLQEYPKHIDEIFDENIIPSNPPEAVIFSLQDSQEDIKQYIEQQEKYRSYPLYFSNIFSY